ncbi:Anoctamin [Paragonimus heterotremus]|uniref:Anoctamin n=1 Tax=Paragonimus heterotremus TaxID=100268 RepID=A0A8J4WS28_9TREM|nr:Anoctamin [Paragonimus heterotremus]
MSAEWCAEFCLFISSSLKHQHLPKHEFQSQIANRIAMCFNGAKDPRKYKGDEMTAPLWAKACCQSTPTGDSVCKHADHFVLVYVSHALLKEYATYLRPDLKEDNQKLIDSLSTLSPGQRSWLAELALRSFSLDKDVFAELVSSLVCVDVNRLHAVQSNERGPTLFHLLQLKLVNEVVLCHNKAERLNVWRRNFDQFRWFPDSTALRSYFGDSVGFYFTWMRTYSLCLLGPTAAGLLCWIISSIVSYFSDTSEPEMPSRTLLSIRLLFTLFMILWALICTKIWSRQHAYLVESWSANTILERLTNDCAWLFRLVDQRLEFHGEWRRSRVTGQLELHFTASKRRLRYFVSGLVIVFCLFLAAIVHILLLNLEGFVTESKSPFCYVSFVGQFAHDGALFDPNQSGFWPYLPGIFHSLFVYLMNQVVFYYIAHRLTDFENHQGTEDHNQALIIKRFLFEMLDAYGCLAYLGFVLSDREALASLQLTMLTTNCLRRFIMEVLIPFIIYRFRVWQEKLTSGRRKREDENSTSGSDDHPVWWSDFRRELCADSYEPFDDYLEMVLEHGYLVLFAYVTPLRGAALAFLTILFEAHSDALKMLLVTRRPSPRPLLQGNYIWLSLLAAQAWLSILTNAGLVIASLEPFELDISPSILFLLLEHTLVLIGLAVHFFVQDVPACVRDARRATDTAIHIESCVWGSCQMIRISFVCNMIIRR